MDESKVIRDYQSGLSTYKVAEQNGTNQAKVIRILKKNQIDLRSKSEAQKNSLESGVSTHPTKGKKLSEETREKQSKSQVSRWKDMDPDKRQELKELAKDRWENMDPDEKKDMLSKAGEALYRASKEGSAAEKFIVKKLSDAGFSVNIHVEGLIEGEYEIDIFLPDYGIAIELDGPQHFEPVFGQERLNRAIVYDSIKNGLLISRGFHIIRVKYIVKKLTENIKRKLWEKISSVVDDILNNRVKEKLIEVEVTNE